MSRSLESYRHIIIFVQTGRYHGNLSGDPDFIAHFHPLDGAGRGLFQRGDKKRKLYMIVSQGDFLGNPLDNPEKLAIACYGMSQAAIVSRVECFCERFRIREDQVSKDALRKLALAAKQMARRGKIPFWLKDPSLQT